MNFIPSDVTRWINSAGLWFGTYTKCAPLTSAAVAKGNLKDTHLSYFFKWVAYKKGRTVAVSATARKLAVIIWTMITKKINYQAPTDYLFLDQKRKVKLVTHIKKQIAKFDLKPDDVGFITA